MVSLFDKSLFHGVLPTSCTLALNDTFGNQVVDMQWKVDCRLAMGATAGSRVIAGKRINNLRLWYMDNNLLLPYHNVEKKNL